MSDFWFVFTLFPLDINCFYKSSRMCFKDVCQCPLSWPLSWEHLSFNVINSILINLIN